MTVGTADNPYKLCVMGNPIEHSKSPWIHAEFAKQFNLVIDYIKIKPALDEFEQEALRFKKQGGYGANITIPFKQRAYALATECSPRAAIAKSVNTIVYCADGRIYGDNTDGIGLINDLTQNFNYAIKNKSVLILGAGGAVRGILHPLLSEVPLLITIVNRTVEKAIQLANEFEAYGKIQSCGFAELAAQQYDLVIDGTGFSDEALHLPETLQLSSQSLCYDLKYSNVATHFMKWAQQKNALIITDGLGMLIEQAAEAFYLWTGKKPVTNVVLEKTKKL